MPSANTIQIQSKMACVGFCMHRKQAYRSRKMYRSRSRLNRRDSTVERTKYMIRFKAYSQNSCSAQKHKRKASSDKRKEDANILAACEFARALSSDYPLWKRRINKSTVRFLFQSFERKEKRKKNFRTIFLSFSHFNRRFFNSISYT